MQFLATALQVADTIPANITARGKRDRDVTVRKERNEGYERESQRDRVDMIQFVQHSYNCL